MTKKELVSDIKTLIIRRKTDGKLITGEYIRVILGLPSNKDIKIKNIDIVDFDIFIQSTSPIRKLIEGTTVLYKSDIDNNSIPVIEISESENIIETEQENKEIIKECLDKVNEGPKITELLITFDTTGSMYPCLTQVRNNVKIIIKDLFQMIPGIRIGIIAHGDYDYNGRKDIYVTKQIDLSVNKEKLCEFVESVEQTNGFDCKECYELVLREAHTKISWSNIAKKIIIMIGDDEPHSINSSRNINKIDWRLEAKKLNEKEIKVYSVQALGNK